ncbi:hypothetical protein ATY79_08910 [Rhizobium sp. R693]|nr:hypothetical protein ATY79_08910 [Rhizobium sp. R693]
MMFGPAKEKQMNRLRNFLVAGALLSLATMASACTSTTSQPNQNSSLNSACALGFNNDRPCSY